MAGGDGHKITGDAHSTGPAADGPTTADSPAPRLDTLESIRQAVSARSSELTMLLESLTSEQELLVRALGALDSARTMDLEPVPQIARPMQPAPAGRETRADQTIRLLASRPGLRSGDLARAMGISPQYVYRVVSKLGREGRIVKIGSSYALTRDWPGEGAGGRPEIDGGDETAATLSTPVRRGVLRR